MRRIGLIAVMSIVGLATPALADHETSVHWPRTSNPLTLTVESNVNAPWTDALRDAAAQWSRSPAVTFLVVPGDGTCLDGSAMVEVCASKYGKKGWLGRSGKYIDESDHAWYGYIQINLSYRFTQTKRNFVACHELGHVLGLGHRVETSGDSCMVSAWKYLTEKPSRADDHDIWAIDQMYLHSDGPIETAEPATARAEAVVAVGEDLARLPGRTSFVAPTPLRAGGRRGLSDT